MKNKKATAIIIAMFFANFSVSTYSKVNEFIKVVPSDSKVKTVVNGNIQHPVKFSTVWSDKEGATHISDCRFEGLEFKSYAPPAEPQWVGISPDDVESIAYAVLPVGYVGSWHHSPGPQWVITLSGKWSVETTDGSVLVQGPGEMHFDADSDSHPRKNDTRVGHISRTVGSEPNVQLIIRLKKDISNSNLKGKCAF